MMFGLAVAAAIVSLYAYAKFGTRVARRLAANSESKLWKWGIGMAVAIMMILIPTADSIVGRIYFAHLCATEAGVTVFRRVELPAEYWDMAGAFRFSLVKDKYTSSYTEDHNVGFIAIDRGVYSLSDQSGKVLAKDVVFRYWGGWMERTFLPQDTAATCGAENMNVVFKRAIQVR